MSEERRPTLQTVAVRAAVSRQTVSNALNAPHLVRSDTLERVLGVVSDLGYRPVTFSELTTSEDFWKGCKSCKNYSILMENERKMCLCTGMLYDTPEKQLVQVQVPDFATLTPTLPLAHDSASDPETDSAL